MRESNVQVVSPFPWAQRRVLTWGSVALAIIAISTVVDATLPAVVRYYNSDPAPYEGKLEHAKDLEGQMGPIMKSLGDINATSEKLTQSVNHIEMAERVRQLESDQRELCSLVDRVANVNLRLNIDPADSLAIETFRMLQVQIARKRARIVAQQGSPEC